MVLTIPASQFAEFKRNELSMWSIDDFNRLLPQLSAKADSLSMMRLYDILSSGTRIFVARFDDQIVGTVLLTFQDILVGTKAWIEDVVVDQAFRGQGIATELMNMAEIAAWVRGADSINLTSNPSRLNARAMYEHRGYVLRDTGVFRKHRPESCD